MKQNETQSLDTKCEMCGGTRETLAIRRTLFYSVAKRVGQLYLSRVAKHEAPTPRPRALAAHPFAPFRPGPRHTS